MHDDPAKRWRIGDLAIIAGMKRGRFIETFANTVGQSPAAYLTDRRLELGERTYVPTGALRLSPQLLDLVALRPFPDHSLNHIGIRPVVR